MTFKSMYLLAEALESRHMSEADRIAWISELRGSAMRLERDWMDAREEEREAKGVRD